MSAPEYKSLGAAPTLFELRGLIEAAIAEAGPDAEWNGFDDGAIYIHGSNQRWLSIENRVQMASPEQLA